MTSTIIAPAVAPAASTHRRPTGAKLRGALSLRARLAILVALSTAIVIGIEAFLEIRVFEREAALDLALQAVRTSSTAFGSTAVGMAAVAVPVTRADGTRAAAVATVSLGALEQ